jgi:hypothetical protein
MELSWLKRQLRKPGYPSFEEAQDLLDAIDRVYEDAQEYEQTLLHDGEINPYEEMSHFVKENAEMLVHNLLLFPSIGVQGVLDVLIASKGYEGVLHELEEWKKQPHEKARLNEEFLEDLEHPW